MHPILLKVPGVVLKGLAFVALFGGLLATVLALGRGGKFRERFLGLGLSGLIGGLILFRVMAGHNGFYTPSGWSVAWTAVPIYSYGVMLGLSLFAGWYVALSLARRDNLP